MVDLRGNPGGSLNATVYMAKLLTPPGPVVQVRNTFGRVDVMPAEQDRPLLEKAKIKEGGYYKHPLVVLTNKGSASASDLTSAILQDYNRAIIVGGKSTYGKGTVQTTKSVAKHMKPFEEDNRKGGMAVTIQKFYRASGGATQNRGVTPDIQLPFYMDALDIGEANLETALPYDEIKKAEYVPLDPKKLHREELNKVSSERVQKERDFQYIVEDMKREEERKKNNILSLNLSKRLAKLKESDDRFDRIKEERKKRYAEVEEKEKGWFTRYKLTMDNVRDPELHLADEVEEESGMKPQLSEEEKDQLKFPHGLDLYKREGIHILLDLIRLNGEK